MLSGRRWEKLERLLEEMGFRKKISQKKDFLVFIMDKSTQLIIRLLTRQ